MRLIDANVVIDMSMPVLCGGGYEEMAVLVENIEAVPTIRTKQIKYYDNDENAWKVESVIVDE